MGLLGKNIKFWGAVGVVAGAMKLKDRWDEYRQVPNHDPEEALGAGPVALHSPTIESPPPNYMVLDTEIPAITTRPTRKRSKSCCMCCGTNCGLFWKAFGIVCLITFLYQSFRLVRWAISKPSDGLWGMPKFGESLECADAPFIYQPDKTIYTVPIGVARADHTVEICGGAVGTIILAAGSPNVEDIEFEMKLRTDNKDLLETVFMDYPSPEDVQAGITSSRIKLATPSVVDSCMRFDVIMRVPSSLRELKIVSQSITQIEFSTNNSVALDRLDVSLLHSHSELNLLLPHGEVAAKNLALQVSSGYMVGDVNIAEEVSLNSQGGDALMFITATPVAHTDRDTKPVSAVLNTVTGKGRTDIYYEDPHGVIRRTISSNHRSARGGEVHLHYNDAGFNGHVDLKAKSYTTSGVFGQFNRTEDRLPTAGDGDGDDMLVARSPNGWIGLYI